MNKQNKQIEPGLRSGCNILECAETLSIAIGWNDMPEQRLVSEETLACILSATEALPPSQRAVITLHDLEGWTAEDICNVLGISQTNQRVLLHRHGRMFGGRLSTTLRNRSEAEREAIWRTGSAGCGHIFR